ncbi:hypothetical protein HO173_010022 [Letharia columbiana]|uniref:CFEM domain-containing protein n=1 Tax=Letharia columbiana TaxID=112416 RepID=A0A8H6L162_9LECA|nr:uncharacterized protein HO173_010022 [Letharia columbiana]KAF6231720.1 hypothetical protein HO173_010022 [Letharia columbiana]
MMPLVSAFLLIALSVAAVKATNITGDPTNLANWPPCAQKCIPLGLTAPASCNSLSNLTCICQNPTFSVSIAGCERTSCSTDELKQIENLSIPLCAPVGGQPASVLSAISSYYVTASLTASGLPTYPADATASTAVSAVLATATPQPNFGNPTNILTYPLCAQTCANESVINAGCDTSNVDCACGTVYRSITAACEEISCSAGDRATTSLLAQELCGPVYHNMSSLGSAVSSAIASATSVAAAVASKDPTKSESYPLCAQKCQNTSIPSSGCGSLSNQTCICNSSSLSDLNSCESKTCSASDFQITSDLSYTLCNPVGGIGNNVSNASYVATASTPAPTVFTGGAAAVVKRLVGWSVVGLVGALGWQVLL